MPQAFDTISTRQQAEFLFGTAATLGAGGAYDSPVREVDGFNAVSLFAMSDQPFRILVYQAATIDGPFVVTQIIPSAISGTNQIVDTRVFPTAPFMKTRLENLGGPQAFLSFCVQGIPEP